MNSKSRGRVFYTPPEEMYKTGKSGGLENQTIKAGRNSPCPCGKVELKKYLNEDKKIVEIPVPVKHKNCCLNSKMFIKK